MLIFKLFIFTIYFVFFIVMGIFLYNCNVGFGIELYGIIGVIGTFRVIEALTVGPVENEELGRDDFE